MEKEKLAILALIIIIVGVLVVYLGYQYGGDILSGFETKEVKAVDDNVVFSANSTENTVTVLLNDDYSSDKSINIKILDGPSHGNATVEGSTIVYTPTRGYLGDDTFKYEIDQQGITSTANVNIEISINVIALGDCADVHYIGRYSDNNTIFDSSYNDTDTKTGGTPLKMFISTNSSEVPPKVGYSSIIPGLAEGLVGMKEGDSGLVGPIPPDKAYGAKKLKVGDSFYTNTLAMEMNQTVEVTRLNDNFIDLKWINQDEIGLFTMPQMVILNLSSMDQAEMVLYCPPYYIWENSSEIISSTDEAVTVKTTPTKSENLVEIITPIQYDDIISFIFPDATTATWDDDKITITSSPEVGSNYTYEFEYYGQIMNYIFGIEGITNDSINVSIMLEGTDEKNYQEANRVMEFDRNFDLPAKYEYLPTMYIDYLFGPDLERDGISTNELAGKSLTFEVEIIKVYKTSQE